MLVDIWPFTSNERLPFSATAKAKRLNLALSKPRWNAGYE